jgi:hypothetical protein
VGRGLALTAAVTPFGQDRCDKSQGKNAVAARVTFSALGFTVLV